MLVSPLDWTLIETWKRRGIPLHIVLRGINTSFNGFDQRPSRGRKINSLFFCQQEVEAHYQEYVESRVGADQGVENGASQNGNGDSQFTPAAVSDFLWGRRETLQALRANSSDALLVETFSRTSERLSQIIEDLERDLEQCAGASLESLETDLIMIEEVILDGLREHTGPERLKQIRKEGNDRLRNYRQGMEHEVYEQTINTYVAQRLRELYQVPRLSLFYL
jgi:hypothetical protein